VFLVSKIEPDTSKDGGAAVAEPSSDGTEVPVAADKEKASLIEGPTTLPAPLWQPDGGKVTCKVIIDQEGKIYFLETGKQLCENVPWQQFRYKPLVQGGHPVKVSTDVEISYEPKK